MRGKGERGGEVMEKEEEEEEHLHKMSRAHHFSRSLSEHSGHASQYQRVDQAGMNAEKAKLTLILKSSIIITSNIGGVVIKSFCKLSKK